MVEPMLRTCIVSGMVTDADDKQGPSLLGLRPPADLAEGAPAKRMPAAAPAAVPSPAVAEATARARPSYPVISSGWDSEDEEAPRSKTSDLMTALRAGVVLLIFIVALAMLLR
jgi:hypothetical protein